MHSLRAIVAVTSISVVVVEAEDVVATVVPEVHSASGLLMLVYTTKYPESNRLRIAPGWRSVPEAHLAELLAL